MYISLVKPKGYKYKSGQYAFINIPSVSIFQWHPFSIASSPNGKYLCFMVKKAGDWSNKWIDNFYDIKEKSFRDQCQNLIDTRYDKELRSYLMQMNVDITDETVELNKKLFPSVYISDPISAPAELAAMRRRIIMIGAGSGIAPFLAFLDDQQIKAEGGRRKNGDLAQSYQPEFSGYDKAHLILTSRDADQFSWLSPFLNRILQNDSILDKITLHLYLTSTTCNTLPSFLFWRAFLMREKKKRDVFGQSANPIVGS
jgi:hypothetical protein